MNLRVVAESQNVGMLLGLGKKKNIQSVPKEEVPKTFNLGICMNFLVNCLCNCWFHSSPPKKGVHSTCDQVSLWLVYSAQTPQSFNTWMVGVCFVVLGEPSSHLHRNNWIRRSRPVTVITIKSFANFIVLSSKPNNHFQSLLFEHLRNCRQIAMTSSVVSEMFSSKMTNSEKPDVRIPHAGWCLEAFANRDSRWFDMCRGSCKIRNFDDRYVCCSKPG